MSTKRYTWVDFPCRGIEDVLEWTVQGHSLTDPSNLEISVTTNNISVDVWSLVLNIRALPINDGISVAIGCIVISFSSHNF